MGVFTTLQAVLGRNTWPPPSQHETWEQVELFAALRNADDTRLRMEAGYGWQDEYLVSPLPRIISRASANLLFGEPPEIEAVDEADQENLDRIVGPDGNDLRAELHRAAVLASSEGEVWGRIVVQPDLLDVPIVEFVSRSRVIPHFAGRFLRGATFVTTWQTGPLERYRMLETYEPGAVTTRLYRGSTTVLGSEIALNKFSETEGRQPVVYTGIEEPLVAFIPNSIDADQTRGYADYQGLVDRFLALNESVTIGQANQRLAGQKRAVVNGKLLDQHGNLHGPNDIIRMDPLDSGDGTAAVMQPIDWQAGHTETIAWIDHLIDTTLSFAGISPVSLGRTVEGATVSGTALKLRMNHSLMEAAGKGHYFDRGIARLLRQATIIDGRPVSEGGFGRSYQARDASPTVVRGDGLPRDDMEAAKQLALIVGTESMSLEERVAFLHPDWTEQQRTDEVDRLRSEYPIPPAVEPPAGL